MRRWQAQEPIAARPDSAAYRLAKFVRRHRLGVAAGGVAALALSMLTLLSLAQAWRAERAEKLAQQRSAQADDLLGFMLGEFADKLRPIGRLELLASVGSKAIAHLSESPNVNSPSAASAHSILQRAKALTVLGEVSVAKRELDAALTPLQAARRLLAADPPATAHEHANAALLADWRKAQGTAAFWVGHAYYTKRQFAPARAAWDDYEHYSRQWLLAAPGQFEPTVELSYALSNLGTLLMDEGHLSEAAERIRASIALKQQALALKPLDLPLQAELANSLSLLGTALLWQGEFQPAQALFEQGLQAIVSARQQAPRDLEWAYREAAMRQWLGQAALKLDDRARARSAFQAVIAVTQSLLQQEPKNRRWWQLQSRAEVALANLQAPSPADTRHLQELMAELDALDAGSGGAAATRRLPLRAQASLGLSRQLQAQQQTPAAIDTLTQTLALLRAAANRQPEDLPLQVESGAVRLALSALYEQTHDRLAAQTQCIAVEQELRDLRPLLRLHHEITRLWVQAHSCLNQAGQVQQEQSWLQQRGKPSV